MSIEAMKQALEALQSDLAGQIKKGPLAITALRTAIEQAEKNQFNPDWDAMAVMVEEQQRMAKRIEELEQAEKQAPRCAVIVEVFGKDWRLDYMSLPVGKHKLYTQEYVYTTPQPQRTWVGLTRAERFEIEKAMSKYYDYRHQCKTVCLPEFSAAIEAKLKEKNT